MEHYSNVVKAMIARSNARAADIADKIQARAYYQFQYVPPAGPLPGWSMEQQTEDAINEIGNIAYSSDEIAREAREIAQQAYNRSEEHTSELQSRFDLVCRLLLEKKKITHH